MRKSKYSQQKRLDILAEHDAGATIAELSRKYQISPASLYQWKKAKEIDDDDDKRRIKELEDENKRLKKMYSELSLDHDILKTGYGMLKKWQAQDAKKK